MPKHEPTEIQKTGWAFCQALAIEAEEACERRDPHTVHYIMSRMRQIEGMLRTMERMES